MLNQCVLVGRLKEDPKLITEDGISKTQIVLTIMRGYKNAEGDYDSDEIPCTLWSGIAENTVEYCKKNSTVGVKARLESSEGKLEVITEKVTFINTEKDED